MGLADNQQFPVLQPCDVVHFMAAKGQIGRLLGNLSPQDWESTLMEFWRRYSKECPRHQVFMEENSLQLRRCIPCYIHGDDGRSFKKSGVLLVNLQGALGTGSAPFQKKHAESVQLR